MPFLGSVETIGGVGITRELFLDQDRYLCFTRLSREEGQWVIGVSDGASVWKVGLTEDKVNEYGKGKGQVTVLTDISQALRSGEIQLSRSHDHLRVVLDLASWSSKQLELPLLHQVSAACLGAEVKTLLFSLWDNLHATRTKLQACEQDLLAVDKGKYAEEAMAPTASSAGKTVASKQKRTKGTSLVNPSTKRRKAATGVVFDSENC